MKKDTRTVSVNWEDVKSIRKAERQKSRLENQGYTLIRTIAGVTTSRLVYEKTIDTD